MVREFNLLVGICALVIVSLGLLLPQDMQEPLSVPGALGVLCATAAYMAAWLLAIALGEAVSPRSQPEDLMPITYMVLVIFILFWVVAPLRTLMAEDRGFAVAFYLVTMLGNLYAAFGIGRRSRWKSDQNTPS